MDGLLHVSEMANYRVANVRDELKEGEQVECPESEVRHQIPGAAPAWQGATTENTARIRGRSNAARRDAPPGIW